MFLCFFAHGNRFSAGKSRDNQNSEQKQSDVPFVIFRYVVGAEAETADFFGIFTPRSYHNYRNVRYCTQFAADSESVLAGEHQIKQK